MASFDRAATQVLKFPRRWSDTKPRDERHLLWPALGWRVIAPRPRGRELNLVQKAVLGLLLANCRVSRIADRLALEQDLVALVVLELEQLGLADALGRPTDRGAKSFASEQIEPDEESTVGWVFTDPWTGRIWPHFVTADLPFAPTEVGEDNHQYLADTRGRGGRVRAFTVLPPANKIVGDRPADTDVAGAARAHRRRVRDNQDPNGAPVPVVPRVEFIADAGEPFLLWTRCWSDSHGDWHVDDPLGGEASPRLRRQLEEKLDATPLLRAWLGRVMGGDEQDTGGVALQQRAKWHVEGQLTIRIHDWPSAYERLVAMQRTLLECQLPDSPPDKWSDVAVKAQNAAECILAEVLAGSGNRCAVPTKDDEFHRQLLDEIAARIGFASPLPKGLRGVRAGKIVAAIEASEGGLRPMALALLLSVPENPGHPYRRAAAADPDLLQRIHELAQVRDESGHYRRSSMRRRRQGTAVDTARIEAAARTAMDLARHLLLDRTAPTREPA